MNNNEVTRQSLGIVGMSYKGDFSIETEYKRGNVVVYDGSSYVAKVTTQGNLPTNNEYFQLIARKPIKGTDYFTQEDIDMMVQEVTEDATSEFNQNVVEKTNAFNQNATNKTDTFNQNVTSKTTEFNDNVTSQTTTFNENATSRTNDFNSNSTTKTDAFNSNAEVKTSDFDTNASTKLEEYNTNHTTKLEEYNLNASDKLEEYDTNHIEKLNEYNTNAESKVDEFDKHVDELEERVEVLETVVDGLPKVKEEGTDIILEDTIKGPLKLKLNPSKLEQDTTNGNQLIDFSKIRAINGATAAFNDDILYINGNKAYSSVTADITDLYKNNGGKTLTFKYKNINIDNQFSGICTLIITNNDGSHSYITLLSHDLKNVPTTIPQDTSDISNISFRIFSNNTSTVQESSVVIEEPMLYFDDNDEYEEYTGGEASPNPDYPQEVKVIEKDNTINIKNKNRLKLRNITSTQKGIEIKCLDGVITLNGTSTGTITTSVLSDGTIDIEEGNYVFSANNEKKIEVSSDYLNLIRLSTSGGEVIPRTSLSLGHINNSTNLSLTANKVNFQIRIESGTTLDNFTLKPQLEKGNKKTDWTSPSICQSFPLNFGIDNLFDKSIAKKYELAFNTPYRDGSHYYNANNALTTVFPCKPSTTYTISKKLGSRFRVGYSLEEPEKDVLVFGNVGHDSGGAPITITTDENAKYLSIMYYNADYDVLSEEELFSSIQIEEGDVAHSFSKYEVEPLQYCKIVDHEDEFFYNSSKREDYIDTLENNKWYLKKNTAKVKLNSSMTLYYVEEYNRIQVIDRNPLTPVPEFNSHGYCNIAKITTNGSVSKLPVNSGMIQPSSTNQFSIFLRLEGINSKDDFIEYLDNNDVYVVYQTAEASYILLNDTLQEQLTDIAKALSYNGETNISQVNESLPFNMNASALLDMTTKFENLETRIAELEISA